MRTSLILILLALFAGSLCGQVNTLTDAEAADGWILLFDGKTMFGWTPEGGAQWRLTDGAIAASGAEAGWLRSNSQFADYILKVEFKTGPDGNSGIFLRSAQRGAPAETGYELQIWNKSPNFPTGSLVNHVLAEGAAFTPNEWNSYEVHVQGGQYRVILNGKEVLNAHAAKTLSGYVGLQYNIDSPIEFRNIKLKPLGGEPIFDGRNLNGWTKVGPPEPSGETPVWTVADGAIHVEKGPGELETEAKWANLVLQADVRTNPANADQHPNSGIFFRGAPGVFWSGYEAQIRNQYADGDPAKPVDFGTGGIYHSQPARRVVSRDGTYFTATVVASGRHIAVWINGYPVSDFEDERPEGDSAAEEAVLTPGVVGLQAHDPTTNLDFRNIRVAKLP